MEFDWVTWSIWLLGFVILVIWIVIPIREYRQLIKGKSHERTKIEKKKNSVHERTPTSGKLN